MKIESVEAVPVAASFRHTFRFGTVDRSTSPNVVIIVRTGDGAVGYGEACPVPAFTSETQRSVVELVQERVATAMGLHLAAAVPRLAYPSYLMGPLKYRQQITDEQVEVVDGHIAVPRGAGLGVTVDEKFLRQLDLRRR